MAILFYSFLKDFIFLIYPKFPVLLLGLPSLIQVGKSFMWIDGQVFDLLQIFRPGECRVGLKILTVKHRFSFQK